MCKLVKVKLEPFCQIGNGNWLVVQTFAMVLEIIGRNNNYPLACSSRRDTGKQRQYAALAA